MPKIEIRKSQGKSKGSVFSILLPPVSCQLLATQKTQHREHRGRSTEDTEADSSQLTVKNAERVGAR
jgi:hypothetical protein